MSKMTMEELKDLEVLQKGMESPEVKRAKQALEKSKSINPITRFKGILELEKIRQEVLEKEEIKKQKQEDAKNIISIIKKMFKKIDCKEVDEEGRIRNLINFLSGEVEKEFDPVVLVDATKFISYILTTECSKIDPEKLTKEFKNFVKSSSDARKVYLSDNEPDSKNKGIDLLLARQSTIKNSSSSVD